MWMLAALMLIAIPAAAQRCQDPVLAQAAAEALLRTSPLDAQELLQTAQRLGADAPVVDALLLAEADDGRRERWLAELGIRYAAPVACGEASAEDRWLVVATPRAGSLSWITAHSLRVATAPGWARPTVWVRDARDRSWRTNAGSIVTLPDWLEPPLVVQLVAEGPAGPRPIAERSLGEPSSAAPSGDTTAARLENLRRGQARPSLRANRLMDRVAAEHAARLAREGRVSHLSRAGDPEDRLHAAGIEARHVGEAVACATDFVAAFAALLRSPSHRAALLEPRFTDVGIGEARGERACVVILLAAWPRARSAAANSQRD